MDSYTKKLSFDIDTSFVDKFNSYMSELEKSFLTNEEHAQALEDITKEIEKYTKAISQIELFGDASEETKLMLENTKKTLEILEKKKKALEELQEKGQDTQPTSLSFFKALKLENDTYDSEKKQKEQEAMVNFFKKGGELHQKIVGSFFDAAKAIGDYFKKQFKAALDEAINMASYSLNSSTKYNAQAWDNMMTYGLTGAQSYAFTQAKQAIGVSSDEELYQAMMSPSLQQSFKEYFELYEKSYQEDIEAAKEMQQFQKEMEQFEKEMQMELLGFLSDNKDTISDVLKLSITFMDGVLDALGWMLDFFNDGERTESERSSAASDIINSYTTATTNNHTSVKVDNTFNNVAKEDQTWLANAGQMTYEQIIKALT